MILDVIIDLFDRQVFLYDAKSLPEMLNTLLYALLPHIDPPEAVVKLSLLHKLGNIADRGTDSDNQGTLVSCDRLWKPFEPIQTFPSQCFQCLHICIAPVASTLSALQTLQGLFGLILAV